MLGAVAGGSELCWEKAQSVHPAIRIAAKQRRAIELNIHTLFVFAMNRASPAMESEDGEINHKESLRVIMEEFEEGCNDTFVLS